MRPDNQSPSSLLPADSAGEHLPLALLRQYVAGTLSRPEQYRVERHTQSCQQCADVLAGLSQTDLGTTDKAVSELQARLRARVAEPQPAVATPGVVPMWPWRQLAAVVLLLLVGTGVWLGVRRAADGPASAPPLAQRQTPSVPETYAAAPAPPAAQSSALEAEAPAVAAPPAPSVAQPAPRPKDYASVARPARVMADQAVPHPDAEQSDLSGIVMASTASPVQADSAMRNVSREPLAAASRANDEQEAKTEEVALAAPMRAAAKKAATAHTQAAAAPRAISRMAQEGVVDATALRIATRTVRGRITDRITGEGLGGVQVRVKGETTTINTALDGSFRMTVPATSTALTIERAGYIATEHPLPNDSSALSLTLVLAPKPVETPVLVRREGAPAPVDLAAMPVGGERAFRNYLRDSLHYPAKALKAEKEGSVRLSFVVGADGSLQDIKVIRGLTEECDAEAIRLLKAGPAWHPAIVKGRRTARPVQITVPFRLIDHQ